MRPMIGVLPLVDAERNSLWMLPDYLDGVAQAGGIPVMLPLTEDAEVIRQLAEQFDGFLFTGGQDVEPSVYGAERLDCCGECCSARDGMEQQLLEHVLGLGKPILGICRGLQFVNAALGGTLYQDLPAQKPSEVVHKQSAPYDRPAHAVEVLEESPLFAALGKNRLEVNSLHHQAVWELAPPLRKMALAPDGVVEAAWMPEARFLWAVQWHPEYLHDADSRVLFEKFVKACRI